MRAGRTSPSCLAWRVVLTGVVVLAALPARSAHAQGLTLDEIEARTNEARLDEARLALELWWESASDWSGRDLERALWLRARLTVDPDMAALDYRRLLLEFPSGAYSTRARRRLAQMAAARGEAVAGALRPVYAIELLNTSSYARAARLFDRALRGRLAPRLVTVAGDQGERYRVRVGRFSTRTEAERAARRVERLDFDPRVVDDAREEAVARRQ